MDFIEPLLLTKGFRFPEKGKGNTVYYHGLMTAHPRYYHTHTDCVYATDHRIELKFNILTLLLLTIMTKNHSYWSSLVQHSHLS